jgi:hypothetical protein
LFISCLLLLDTSDVVVVACCWQSSASQTDARYTLRVANCKSNLSKEITNIATPFALAINLFQNKSLTLSP